MTGTDQATLAEFQAIPFPIVLPPDQTHLCSLLPDFMLCSLKRGRLKSKGATDMQEAELCSYRFFHAQLQPFPHTPVLTEFSSNFGKPELLFDEYIIGKKIGFALC